MRKLENDLYRAELSVKVSFDQKNREHLGAGLSEFQHEAREVAAFSLLRQLGIEFEKTCHYLRGKDS